MRRLAGLLAFGLTVLIGVGSVAGPATAAPGDGGAAESSDQGGSETPATPSDDQYEQLLEQGRDAYNDNNYAEAAELYTEAAQLLPNRPEAYRNLARTYFWRKDYPRAVVFYDFYLKLIPDAKDVAKVKRERKLAAQRAGDDVWQRPDAQKRVSGALRDALTDGDAYTEGGGGAWALYKSLIRTGYAAPDLARLKQRLRKKLVDEFEGLLLPDSDEPVPVLNLQQWQRQQMRLEAARSIAVESGVRKVIERRMTIVDTAIALLNGRYDDAADLAEQALEANPDMAFIHWFRLTALAHDERYDEARQVLEAYRKRVDVGADHEQAYLEVMEAILSHREGETDGAADMYRKLLE